MNTVRELSIKDLDPRLKGQLANAEASMGNHAVYAIHVCMGILSRHPGCLEVRKMLRKAQRHARHQTGYGLRRVLSKLTQAWLWLNVIRWLRKDPQRAMTGAEKWITVNPVKGTAHQRLGQAAVALNLWQTAAFAYECWAEVEPTNPAAVIALGDALLHAGRPQEAIAACERILLDSPGHDAVQQLVQRAAVAETIDQGRWVGAGDFREKLAAASNRTSRCAQP